MVGSIPNGFLPVRLHALLHVGYFPMWQAHRGTAWTADVKQKRIIERPTSSHLNSRTLVFEVSSSPTSIIYLFNVFPGGLRFQNFPVPIEYDLSHFLTTTSSRMSQLGGYGPTIIAVMWVETAISLLFVLMRIFTRIRLNRNAGWDDVLIAVSWVKQHNLETYLSGC